MRKQIIKQRIIVVACILTMAIWAYIQTINVQVESGVSDLKIQLVDCGISITWNTQKKEIQKILISFKDRRGAYSQCVSLSPNSEEYEFRGRIDTCYRICVSVVYKDGDVECIDCEDRLLVDMKNLPKIPIIYVTTVTGQDPELGEVKYSDESNHGITSLNNKYEEGKIIYENGQERVQAGLKIKVRGNTSSLQDKKPYKIVLDEPLDLTGNGKAYKEWVLLNCSNYLNNYVGELVGGICGVEWSQQGILVNLVMNGDWKGCYTLINPVSQIASDGLVGKHGYIIENDAYYWASDGAYFQLNDQNDMGYTFKYPEVDAADETQIKEVKEYMEDFFNLCDENNSEAWEYADLNSFVSWAIAREMLQGSDGCGTNIFYYIKDFEGNSEDRKIHMGPLWDFDSAFMFNTYPDMHGHSEQWDARLLPFINNEEFKRAYNEKWEKISEDFENVLFAELAKLLEEYGSAIDSSRNLDSLRWNTDLKFSSVEEEIAVVESWFIDHIEWMNSITAE